MWQVRPVPQVVAGGSSLRGVSDSGVSDSGVSANCASDNYAFSTWLDYCTDSFRFYHTWNPGDV